VNGFKGLGMNKMKILFVVLFLFMQVNSAAVPDYHQTLDRFHAVQGRNGVVAAQEQLAATVGALILKNGGNAVDAAVATGFALMVTLPRAGSLGGGGFMMVALKSDHYQPRFIDFREVAPHDAQLSLMTDEQGNINIKQLSHSWKAAGVPGNVAGLCYIEQRYGKLTLQQVMAPAIDMAVKGIVVQPYLANGLHRYRKVLMADATTKAIFTRADGKLYQSGDVMKRPDLAVTLKAIQQSGSSVFYKGSIAKAIVQASHHDGGFITANDLKQYHVVERKPLTERIDGYQVFTAPPPSSGGIAILQLLQLTQYFNEFHVATSQNTAEEFHLLTELFNYVFLDRNQFVGDPDFVSVPTDRLLSSQHIASIAAAVNRDHHEPSSHLTNRHPGSDEGHHTTHVSTLDNEGSMVALTYSINFSYGSGISVPGTGILLNNTMLDFNLDDTGMNDRLSLGKNNLIQPGKRPLSSMSPVIIEDKDGMPWLATGSPGGPQIITIVAQLLINLMDYHYSLAVASELPRIHAQLFPDIMYYEAGISPDTLVLLKNMGHQIKQTSSMGSLQSVMHNQQGYWGFSDTRRAGAGVATY